jgi:hypothetical protein
VSADIQATIRPVRLSLDAKGRCCGRRPIYYKGGSWRSPLGAPMYHCCDCSAEFGPDGKQRANWAWAAVEGGFAAIVMANGANAKAREKHQKSMAEQA